MLLYDVYVYGFTGVAEKRIKKGAGKEDSSEIYSGSVARMALYP